MVTRKAFFLCFLLSTLALHSRGQINKLSVEYPVIINGNISEFNILYTTSATCKHKARLEIYKTDQLIDSTLIKVLELPEIEFDKGLGKYNLKKHWIANQTNTEKRILAFTNNLPPGKYVVLFKLDSLKQFSSHWQVDSLLSEGAGLNSVISDEVQQRLKKVKGSKNKLNEILADAKKGKFAALKKKDKISEDVNKQVVKSVNRKMPSVDIKTENYKGRQRMSFYYNKTYLGYREIDIKKEIADYTSEQFDRTKKKVVSAAQSNLSPYRTLFEQYKEKKAEEMKKDGINGSISIDSYFDSDQEEFSPNDNIYTEVFADAKMKLLGIPVQLEGYYTTQDRNRNIKASYLRLQYDVQSSKDELEENIQTFKNDYSGKKSNLFAKKSIYGNHMNKLQGSKTKLINDLKKDINLEELSNYNWDEISKNPHLLDQIDTNRLMQQLSEKATRSMDSTGKMDKTKQKLSDKKQKAQQKIEKTRKRIEQLKEIEVKVRKYAALIQQMQKTMHFDSAFVMSKLSQENEMTDYSKNSLLKKNEELLPKNDLSRFTKGIKNLNIGILNQYESDYTMAGQTMRGGGIEYDIKGVDVGLSVGQTEYVSRDLTNLDTYNNIMAKVSYEINEQHRVKLIYFNYKRSNKLKANTFFTSLRNNQLSLNGATNIGSVIYNGQIAKSVDYQFEVAGSARQQVGDQEPAKPNLHQLAYKGSLDYTPAKFPLGFNLAYEKVGKDFTNETLAFIRRNFETKKIATFGEFFKGYLRAKVSFEQLTQNPGEELLRKNTRWGFDVRTVSKRYPNIQLTYKPFTTFSSVYDTFTVAQRNLFGEVMRGKATYQLKRNGKSHRWNLVFNRNRTNIDTLNYETDLIQAGYILNNKGKMYMFQVGKMEMPENVVATNNRKNYFVRANEQLEVLPSIPLQLGQELAWHKGAINRLGVLVGSSYKLKNKPLSFRLQFRYLTYRNSENIMLPIYGSMIGMTYDFQVKKK